MSKTKSASTRQIAALFDNGTARIISEPAPALRRGQVLIEVHASLISPGTELAQSRQQRADSAARGDDEGKLIRTFGYQNAGVVLEVGPEVTQLAVGDRVGCMGGGAKHTNLSVVPQNLAVRLPDKVSFEEGAYGNLAATALHAVRRGKPEMGEYVLIVGMGLVGQLCAQLARLAGAYVMAWDTLPTRLQKGRKLGAHATMRVGHDDPAAVVADFTRGRGFDMAICALGGEIPRLLDDVHDVMRPTPDGHREGRVVVVGGVRTSNLWAAGLGNLDVLSSARTGPGYHDDAWEHGRAGYPHPWVRWSTRDNLEFLFNLVAEGRLKLKPLITHRYPLEQVGEAVDRLLTQPQKAMGCILEPRQAPKARKTRG